MFSGNGTVDTPVRAAPVAGDTIRRKLMQKKRRKPMPERSSRSDVLHELPSLSSEELWVRPESNLRQRRGTTGETNISPATGDRLLALADIALGVKKSVPGGKAKVLSVEAHHQKMGQRKKKISPQSN